MIVNNNPLLGSQRETSGATTLGKYLYQYHYGLYVALQNHSHTMDYAVVMEYHEDVIFINSLDSSKAKYYFNQVKSLKNKLSLSDITRLKNGNSILGKIISSCIKKNYSDGIEEINIVAEKGFSFDDNKLNVTKFQFTGFSDETKESLQKKIRDEIRDSTFQIPEKIYFICPDIKEASCREALHVLILDTVKKVHGDVYSKAGEIYTTLIDEMYRKGRITNNYQTWEEFISKKALTSNKVGDVMEMFVFDESKENEERDLEDILNDFGFHFIKKREFKEYYRRYKMSRISNDIFQLDIKKDIKSKLKSNYGNNLTIVEIVDGVYKNLEPKIISKFSSEIEIKAAIICEFLNR